MSWMRIASAALLLTCLAAAARAVDAPPADPEARRTWIAERREEAMRKREEFLQLSPEEQERIREARRAEREERRAQRDQARRGVEVQGPLPLPVAVGGAPRGASCPAGETCTLRLTPPDGQVVVLTAVWAASKIECDGVAAASPPGGAVASPWWRCGESLSVAGKDAGYLGFLTAK